MRGRVTKDNLPESLERSIGADRPGLQYVVVSAATTLIDYAGGWADLRFRHPMTPETTMMGYSMTKTFTAVAILQLAEEARLSLDDAMDRHLPGTPYGGHGITVRHLLDHTAGLPNPLPLRWAHLVAEAADFDEDAALGRVLLANPRLVSEPGREYRYSNIGYWLLGKIVERVTGHSYVDQVRSNILDRLDPSASGLAFLIGRPESHAAGYLARFSLMNAARSFLTDRRFWDGHDGNWVRVKPHYLDGPAFGGLVGSARAFARFLQDQLADRSVLLRPATKAMLETRQTDSAGRPIPMTLGWHAASVGGTQYWFKEGGGAGFHGEMRLYPGKAIGSVVMANDTQFASTRFLNRVDAAFLDE